MKTILYILYRYVDSCKEVENGLVKITHTLINTHPNIKKEKKSLFIFGRTRLYELPTYIYF